MTKAANPQREEKAHLVALFNQKTVLIRVPATRARHDFFNDVVKCH